MAITFMNISKPQANRLLDFSGVSAGIDSMGNALQYREQMDYRKQQDAKQEARASAAAGRAAESHKLAMEEAKEAKRREAISRAAGVAQLIDQEQDPAKRQMMWGKFVGSDPRFTETLTKYGIDPADHTMGPKFLISETRGYLEPKAADQPKVMEVGGRLVRVGPNGTAEEIYAPPPGAQGQTEYGLVPQYAQDAQGNIVPWVAGKSGEPKMLTLPDGVRALAPADTAYQRAQGKELGEAAGSAQADLQRVTDNANLALTTIQRIRQHPGRGAGLGMSAPMGLVPGSEARGFANLVDQAAGQTFLEAFNSLRGGGQITEAEGRKATQALARLDRYQSEGDFMQALKDLEEVINIGVQRARTRAGGFATQAPPAAAPSQAPDPLGIR